MSEFGDHVMVGMSKAALVMSSGSVDVASTQRMADSVPALLEGFGLSSRCTSFEMDAVMPRKKERKLALSVYRSLSFFLITMLTAHMNAPVMRSIKVAGVWKGQSGDKRDARRVHQWNKKPSTVVAMMTAVMVRCCIHTYEDREMPNSNNEISKRTGNVCSTASKCHASRLSNFCCLLLPRSSRDPHPNRLSL